ncbi:MAG: hypothetical protein HY390_03065 [Deltaproteobacteria bacterium]|nr:hypothetical protein [Deltaproteobacteria bacterium]
MKKIFLSISLFCFSVGVYADILVVKVGLPISSRNNIIEWKMGEEAIYTIQAGMFGKGILKKKVISEEKDAVCVDVQIDTDLWKQSLQAWISKKNGHLLKLVLDGNETPMAASDYDISERQKEIEMGVSAGTFKTTQVTLTDKMDRSVLETWLDAKNVPLGGMVKHVVQSDFIKVQLELKEFRLILQAEPPSGAF